MGKQHTTINIDINLVKEAKRKFLNISKLTEEAIKDKLKKTDVTIEEPDKCHVCGRVEEKATADNLMGMTWLWPDEKWICDSCLNYKKKGVHVGQ